VPPPLVSVLVTAYNREAFIAEAIESVLASTLKNFELIVVDDASQDRTVEIAQAYRSDRRVKVYRNETRLGQFSNRNRAAALAQGEYLKYLDSDDIMYAHGLEAMLAAMRRFPEAALGLCRPPSAQHPYPIQVEPESAYREHFFGSGLFIPGPSAAIIRSDAFRALGGFRARHVAGDYEMWLRLGARYPVVKMADGLIWWRRHPGQEFRVAVESDAYYFLNFHIGIEALRDESCPLSEAERAKAIDLMTHRQARLVWRMALRERRFRTAVALYRDGGLSFGQLLRGLRRA